MPYIQFAETIVWRIVNDGKNGLYKVTVTAGTGIVFLVLSRKWSSTSKTRSRSPERESSAEKLVCNVSKIM